MNGTLESRAEAWAMDRDQFGSHPLCAGSEIRTATEREIPDAGS